jgi:myxalamid-type polyketide synthase MxaB
MAISLADLVFGSATPEEQLHQTQHTQPVIFAFGYALARMWESWGVAPSYVLGHSIGELAAACLAGVMPVNEALEFVALRGKLIQESTEAG